MGINRMFTIIGDSGDKRSFITDSVSGERFQLRPGYFYFTPCGHPTGWDLSPELRFVSLHFNLELFYGFDLFRNYNRCISRKAPELAAELEELIHKEEEISTLCRLNEIIYGLCVELLKLQPENFQVNLKWHNYQTVFDYVQKYGDASTTVEELAAMMKVRNNVFSRNFSRDIGIPPKEFLLRTLTRKASERLMIPGSSVKQTAEDLNFSSEYYFSGFFKRQTGMSPRDFQKNNGIK